MSSLCRIGLLVLAGVVAATVSNAEPLKVGILKVGGSGPIYLAQDRGYFAAEGLETNLVTFGAGEAVSVAVVSGDVDIAATGLTASLYNLASGGQIRVVAGMHREAPGFKMQGYFASKRAYDAGLKSLKDLPGHSIALTTIGSTTHYAVGLLAMKYGFPLSSVKIVPLQSMTNSSAAVIGGQTDAGILPGTLSAELARGGAVNLGWVGNETPWQIGSVFVTTKTANGRGDMIKKFLRALELGARDYRAAFVNAKEQREDSATAPEALAVLAKYIGASPADLDPQLPWVDPKLRLDMKDVARQIEWYKSQGMVKGDITVDKLVDMRYAPPFPNSP